MKTRRNPSVFHVLREFVIQGNMYYMFSIGIHREYTFYTLYYLQLYH